MSRYILEEFHSNPARVRRIYATASRERARALHAAFAWLRRHLTPHFHVHAPRWIARLG